MNTLLFANLLAAHLLGDFLFQTDSLCERKKTRKAKCKFLYIHALIITVLAFAVGNSWSFWSWALLIGVSHLLMDLLKCYQKEHTLLWFTIDQLFHVAVIIAVSYFAGESWQPCYFLPDDMVLKLPVFLCATLICTKPATMRLSMSSST